MYKPHKAYLNLKEKFIFLLIFHVTYLVVDIQIIKCLFISASSLSRCTFHLKFEYISWKLGELLGKTIHKQLTADFCLQMETPEKASACLTPIKTSGFESTIATIANRVNEISNILENNQRRWIALQNQDLQLVNNLLRLTEKPSESDPEKLNEFWERLEAQSTKISLLLTEYENVLATHSKCLADFKGLRKMSELSKDFRWKSWTLEQLYKRNADLLDNMREEYEIKTISYRCIPHCYEKAELEFHRTMLKNPDKCVNLQFLATSALDSGKSKLQESIQHLSPK